MKARERCGTLVEWSLQISEIRGSNPIHADVYSFSVKICVCKEEK